MDIETQFHRQQYETDHFNVQHSFTECSEREHPTQWEVGMNGKGVLEKDWTEVKPKGGERTLHGVGREWTNTHEAMWEEQAL